MKVIVRVDLKYYQHQKKKKYLSEGIEMLTNHTGVTILQFVNVSNHHIMNLKLTYVICQQYPNKLK